MNSSSYSFKSHNMFSHSIHVSVRSSEEAPPRRVGLQTRYGQGAASVPRSGGFVAGDAIPHILRTVTDWWRRGREGLLTSTSGVCTDQLTRQTSRGCPLSSASSPYPSLRHLVPRQTIVPTCLLFLCSPITRTQRASAHESRTYMYLPSLHVSSVQK